MTAPRAARGDGTAGADTTQVYLDGRRVGVLSREREGIHAIRFTYDVAVLDDPTAAVSVRLPVRAAAYEAHEALPCFENLLPDGELRDLLAREVHRHWSDVVGLLGVFGGECAGALALWPEGATPPAVPQYRSCSAEDVRLAFAPAAFAGPEDFAPRTPGAGRAPAGDDRPGVADLLAAPDPAAFAAGSRPGGHRLLWHADDAEGSVGAELPMILRAARLSMSGAQEKLALYRRPPRDPEDVAGPPATDTAAARLEPQAQYRPAYQLPVAGAPSTVLVKRERGRFPGLVQNEIAAMAMMAAAGVPTASHTVCALDPQVYETARFDRLCDDAGRVRRLHAEDGCQLTGRRPHAKYAQQGGPTYAELRTVLRRHSADPLTDAERLFRWAVANLALGNRDAHAKNLSLLYETPGVRRLAPAYDVVCTMAYRNLDTVLPLSFGGHLYLEALTPAALPKAAREFGLTTARARDLVTDVCDRVGRGRADALHAAERRAGAHPVLAVVDAAVQALTARTRLALLTG